MSLRWLIATGLHQLPLILHFKLRSSWKLTHVGIYYFEFEAFLQWKESILWYLLNYHSRPVEKAFLHGYHVYEALYQNWEIYGPWNKGSGPGVQAMWPYSENVFNINLKSSSILPQQGKINMHGCDVYEALYKNCKIHGVWVRRPGSWVGPIWPYKVKNVLNFRKSLQYQSDPT